jgi:hypothetical protein
MGRRGWAIWQGELLVGRTSKRAIFLRSVTDPNSQVWPDGLVEWFCTGGKQWVRIADITSVHEG